MLRRCVWSRNIKNGCSIYVYNICRLKVNDLTLILLTWRKWWAPNNASKQQMVFNSGFKELTNIPYHITSSHPDDLCCVTVWAYVTSSKAVSFGSPNRTLHTLRIFGIKNVVTHTLPVSPPSPAASSSLPTLNIPVYPTASGARAKCLSDNECRMDIISKLPHYPYLSMCDTVNKQTITLVHCHCSLQIGLFSHPVDKSIRLTF